MSLSSCDLPTNLNPAYRDERRPTPDFNFIKCPIFNSEGEVIDYERIEFYYEQFSRHAIVYLPKFHAHRDDVTSMIQDLYKNFNIEYR